MIAAIRAWRRYRNRVARTSQPPSAAVNLVPRTLPPPFGQDARVRRVFGLDGSSPLPKVDEQSMLRYREHLAAHLTFPFKAEFYDVFEGAVCDGLVTATRLLGLVRATPFARFGLECEILVLGGPVVVALTALRPSPRTDNRQLIDDYHYWLRRCR